MKLTLISAWNDSGGGLLNRLFDGHPQFQVWPYELQLGTGLTPDKFSSWFKAKYRWPEFISGQSAANCFDAIIDDELKSSLTRKWSAKHHNYQVAADIKQWRQLFISRLEDSSCRAEIIKIYLQTFQQISGSNIKPRILGHCPVLIMDAEKIWADFPDTNIIHIIRDPRCSFVDFNKRNPDVSIDDYMHKWSVVNRMAYTQSLKYPDKVKLICLKDLLEQQQKILTELCHWLNTDFHDTLMQPSWQGEKLQADNMGPFGGVPDATLEAEHKRIMSLSAGLRDTIEAYCFTDKSLLSKSGINFSY